jgi:spore coat protein CotH
MRNGFARRALAAAVALWCGSLNVAWAQTQEALFSNDGPLQEIRLRVSPRDWGTLKETADLDTYYPADLTWKGLTVRNIGIRSRGNTTRNGIKPGLRIDFNRYLSKQEFLGLKALALDNAYSDASLMREWMAMKVFARMGLTAPRESHARVYINDEYAGLYVIIEAIDRPFIARTFGASEADLERGGYLFEYNWVRPYTFEYLGPGLAASMNLLRS